MVINRLVNDGESVEKFTNSQIEHVENDGTDGVTDWVTVYLDDNTYIILTHNEVKMIAKALKVADLSTEID